MADEERPLNDFKGIIESERTARELLEDARAADREREERLLRLAGVREEK